METYNNRYSANRIISTDVDGKTFEVYDEFKKQKCRFRLFNRNSQFDPKESFSDKFIIYTRAVHKNLLRSYRFDILDLQNPDNSEIKEREFFFTSEYVDERTRLNYTKLSYKDRLYVLESVLRATSYLHFMGIVYGKLSFSNIFIHREKRKKISVKLNDLATIVSSRTNGFNTFSESKFSVSRREADQLSEKSDIYSLGVLTYYLVTGKDYLNENIDYESMQHLDEKLADIIASSTHVDTDKRPKSVLELWKSLVSVLGISIDFIDKKYYEQIDFSGAFVAHYNKRDKILNDVYSFFDGSGSNSISFVRSRSGMGKTRFLHETKHRIRINGLNPILIEAGLKKEKETKYPTFSKILRTILEKYNLRQGVIDLLGHDLVHLVPEYSEIWRVSPSAVDDSEVMHNRIIARYLGFLEEVSGNLSLVIMIDNVDKLNVEEIDLLSAIIKNEDSKGPYLILSINDMPEEFQDWAIAEKYSFITLNPLNYHDTVNYLMRLLNIGNLAKLIAREITGICHGNPRAMEKSIVHLYELGRIAISDEREWEIIDLDFSITREEAVKMGYSNIDNLLDSFSANAVEILKRLAVYSQRVDVFFAIRYVKLSGKDFNSAMKELLESGIILRSTSDWGNYYEFSDYRLIDLIYQKTSKKDRVRMHADAAATYLDEFKSKEFMFDSYIYHLIHSGQKNTAIEALSSKADVYSAKRLLTQALEYYEYALSIIDDEEDKSQELKYLNKIAETQYALGNVYSAEENYKKLIALNDEDFYDESKIKALLNLISIYLMKNRTDLVDEYFQQLEYHSNVEKKNIDLYFKVKLIEIRIKEAHQKNDEIVELVKNLYKTAIENSEDFFIGLSLFELAKLNLIEGKINDAVNKLEKSLNLIKNEKENYEYLIEIYRELGNIYVFYLNDLKKADYYLYRAYELAEKTNRFWSFSMILVDLSYLKYLRDEYEEAKTLCIEAEKFAIQSSNSEVLMRSSIGIAQISLVLEDYETCNMQLDKYEDIFETCKLRENKEYYYYFLLIKAEVYMVFRVMPFVKNLINKIEKNGLIHMNSSKHFKYKLLCAKYHYVSYVLFGEEMNLDSLDDLFKISRTDEDTILLKEFLLNTAISAYVDEKFEIFNKCCDLLLVIRDGTERINTALKYEFVNTLIIGDIEMVRPYAEQIAQDVLPYSWKIYCILADLQFEAGKKVEALAYYIEAAGQFYDRVTKVPLSYREKRIDMDFAIKKIELRVNVLKDELYGLAQFDESSGIFSKKLQQKIVKDKTFIEHSNEHYNRKHGMSIPSWQNLISRLDDDSMRNVEKLLKFMTQFTLSKYGAIFLVDDHEEIVEEFSTDKYYKDVRAVDYISKLKTKDLDYDYIEKTTAGISNAGWYNDKSILVFSIYLREENSKFYFRRSEDTHTELKRLLAYVYLESKEITNNLNVRTYKNIMSYEGLTSLIINDYNMTKNATVDKLTGTYIRSYVQDKVDKLFERNDPVKWNFSVLMIDIDHFKDVNDNYGHRRGDEVLSKIGEILKNSVRKTDLVGRYGGEEFIIILVNAPKEPAIKIAEKIRVSIENSKLLGDDRPLTISIGVSSYPNDSKQFETLVENADKALYHSKNTGRNKVSFYNTSMDTSEIRHDMLAGIMTPNASENSRRMKALLDIVNAISLDMDTEKKMESVLGLVLDIVHGIEIGVISKDGASYYRRNNDEKIRRESLLEQAYIKEILSCERGAFVKWKDTGDGDGAFNSYNRKTYAISKLTKEGRDLGDLFVWSTIKDKEYSYMDYSFLAGISPLIATILDSKNKKK